MVVTILCAKINSWNRAGGNIADSSYRRYYRRDEDKTRTRMGQWTLVVSRIALVFCAAGWTSRWLVFNKGRWSLHGRSTRTAYWRDQIRIITQNLCEIFRRVFIPCWRRRRFGYCLAVKPARWGWYGRIAGWTADRCGATSVAGGRTPDQKPKASGCAAPPLPVQKKFWPIFGYRSTLSMFMNKSVKLNHRKLKRFPSNVHYQQNKSIFKHSLS